MLLLIFAGVLVFLINLPFGYWRSGVRKFSVQWFLAIHLPVPFVYMIRTYAEIGWSVLSFIILVGFFFLGQYIGSRFIKRFAAGKI
ncbi:MAG TPA: hypothetical protein VHP30_01105 [Ignavibacteriales bacterium]|nr:hypothetical protein [Ignavibacteriales bacterium]